MGDTVKNDIAEFIKWWKGFNPVAKTMMIEEMKRIDQQTTMVFQAVDSLWLGHLVAAGMVVRNVNDGRAVFTDTGRKVYDTFFV